MFRAIYINGSARLVTINVKQDRLVGGGSLEFINWLKTSRPTDSPNCVRSGEESVHAANLWI